jgi:hypothetical protein
MPNPGLPAWMKVCIDLINQHNAGEVNRKFIFFEVFRMLWICKLLRYILHCLTCQYAEKCIPFQGVISKIRFFT